MILGKEHPKAKVYLLIHVTSVLGINGILEFNVFEITPVSSTSRFISSTNELGRTRQNIRQLRDNDVKYNTIITDDFSILFCVFKTYFNINIFTHIFGEFSK